MKLPFPGGGFMDIIATLKKKSIRNKGITGEDAWRLVEAGSRRPFVLMAAAGEIRDHFHGRTISLCTALDVKAGQCGEDCAFCAQSVHYRNKPVTRPMKRAGEIVALATAAAGEGCERCGLVVRGRGIWAKREWTALLRAVEEIGKTGLMPCASLGILTPERARALREAGLERYHHQLAVSRGYFPRVCTTHAYDKEVETLRVARDAGLSLCAGGMFGLGEGLTQRMELAMTLRELGVEAVSLDMATPVSGSPLAGRPAPPPLELLISLALWRFLLPDRELRLGGGKEKHLRRLLPLGVVAGANALRLDGDEIPPDMPPETVRVMIGDLGFRPSREAVHVCKCRGDCSLEEKQG